MYIGTTIDGGKNEKVLALGIVPLRRNIPHTKMID